MSSRRAYSRMHATFWTSPTIRALGDDGRTLAAYLLTGPHSNMLGCFRLPDAYVADDLGWGIERVAKGFDKLAAHGFAERDQESKWVFVARYIYWNPAENPNQAKAMCRLWLDVPVDRFSRQIAGIMLGQTKLNEEQMKALGKGSETLSHSGSGSGDRSGDRDQSFVPSDSSDGTGGEPPAGDSWGLAPAGESPDAPPTPTPLKASKPDIAFALLTVDEQRLVNAIAQAAELVPIVKSPNALAQKLCAIAPGVDGSREIVAASAWLLANPKRKKSNGSLFLVNWFSRAQESASRRPHGFAAPPTPAPRERPLTDEEARSLQDRLKAESDRRLKPGEPWSGW